MANTDLKSVVLVTLIMAASVYFLMFQNSLFMANFNSQPAPDQGQVKATALLPGNTSPSWVADGLAYSCDDRGPGVLQITNERHAVTIVSLSITYGGMTYSTSGPRCTIPNGTGAISITSLDTPAGSRYSPYGGYVLTSDGVQIPFSGLWA